jgi:hypothetical protein
LATSELFALSCPRKRPDGRRETSRQARQGEVAPGIEQRVERGEGICRRCLDAARPSGQPPEPPEPIPCTAGDGIGKEVTPAGLEVLHAVAQREGGFEWTFDRFDWDRTIIARPVQPDGREQIANHDAI